MSKIFYDRYKGDSKLKDGRYNLLKESGLFENEREMKKMLFDDRFNGLALYYINLFEINKLTLLLNLCKENGLMERNPNHLKSNDFGKPLRKKSLKKFVFDIITDENCINAFNSMEMQKFELLLNSKKTKCWGLEKILGKPNIAKELIAMDISKLGYVLDNLHGDYILGILKNQICLKYLKIMNNEKLKLLCECGRFNRCLIISILKYRKISEIIRVIDIEKFGDLIEKNEFLNYLIIRLFGKMNSERLLKIQILLNHDHYCDQTLSLLLRRTNAYDAMNSLSVEHVLTLINHSRFNRNCLYMVLESHSIISRINLLEKQKFKLICGMLKANLILDMLHSDVAIENINSIHFEKLKILLQNQNHFVDYMVRVSISGTKEFILAFNLMDIEKLKVLANFKNGYDALIWATNNKETFDFIKATKIENLRIILRHLKSISDISTHFDGDLRRNLEFAIALYKADEISEITSEFLHDNEAVNRAIISLFPKGFPVDQMLVPSSLPNEGRVLSLTHLSLTALI